MPIQIKSWTAKEVQKMNEESFLVDLLDTIKISPELADTDHDVEVMKAKLDAIEARINLRLDQSS